MPKVNFELALIKVHPHYTTNGGRNQTKLYKGFNKDMTCLGFHACENPLDCYGYYAPGKSVYHEVELEEVSDQRERTDSKRVGKTIKIGAALDVAGICKAHFEYVKSHCVAERERVAGDHESASAGESGSASAGESGSASAGESGSASAGNYGSASAGNYGSASAGESGSASAGESGSASAGESGSASAGYKGSASAGYKGSASAGESGSASAGNYGSASAGESGISACRGGRVKGAINAVIACAETDDDGKNVSCACAIVDSEKIKPDVWYVVRDGSFVEESLQ